MCNLYNRLEKCHTCETLAALYARYLCSRDALGLKAEQPVGQARRATIGYLVYTIQLAATIFLTFHNNQTSLIPQKQESQNNLLLIFTWLDNCSC